MKQEHFGQHMKTSFILGFFMAIVGAFLGATYLMNEAPDRLSPSVFAEAEGDLESLTSEGPVPVYLLPVNDREGASFAVKRQIFLENNADSVEFSEAELNAWLRANFTPVEQETDSRPIALLPSVPTVSIHDGYLQIIMDLELVLMGDEKAGKFVAQGTFVESENTWVFEASDAAFASARVPGGSLVATGLVRFFKSVFEAAPEYQALVEAWGEIAEIEVERDIIRLSRG